MLKIFYRIQRVAILSDLIYFLDLLYMIQNVKCALLVIAALVLFLLSLLYFFSNEAQETLRVADLGLFIRTTFWQVVFISMSMTTSVNILVSVNMEPGIGIPLTLILLPSLVISFLRGSVSLLDWLVTTHGEHQIVRMLVPSSFDSSDTDEGLEKN